jgi:hypothetical protein
MRDIDTRWTRGQLRHGQLTVGENKSMSDVNKINRTKQINPYHDDVQIICHSLVLLYFLILNREKVMYNVLVIKKGKVVPVLN